MQVIGPRQRLADRGERHAKGIAARGEHVAVVAAAEVSDERREGLSVVSVVSGIAGIQKALAPDFVRKGFCRA